MKMVSAAKLRRAQDAILQMRPYAQKLQEMLSNIVSNSSQDMELRLAVDRPAEHILLIPISSDRGLCGAYNAQVIKTCVATIQKKYKTQHAQGKVTIAPVGKKAYEYFVRHEYPVIDTFKDLFQDLRFDRVRLLADFAIESFEEQRFDRVELVYSQFRNAATQVFINEPFLPIPRVEAPAEAKGQVADFLFEPNREELMEALMPKILSTQVFKAVLDAHASEHGARMTAMDKASENANEMLRGLKISYNRARQAAITTELTEIVSGAAALGS